MRSNYDSTGVLETIDNPDSGYVYWRRLNSDLRGNVTNMRFGNGVETTRSFDAATGRLTAINSAKPNAQAVQALTYNFDTLGNLTSRADTLQGLSETFGYDKLNRVVSINTTAKATSGATSNTIKSVTYGPSGNILSRSDVGAYSYAATASGCAGLTGVRASAPGLHALSAVSGIKNAGYCYDDNGNMIAGDGRSVTWSAYDMVTAISRGSAAVGFDYGTDRQRFRRVDVDAEGKATTTLYVGGKAMELITRPGGVVETKVYLGDFAVLSSTTGPSAPVTPARLEYLHRDHLGSVDTITDAAGAVIQRMSFDAWGKRRETGWLPIGANGIVAFDTKTTTRGFTGHEMIDSVGLVHMNGRIYDPEIGRFLSADPHVQAPDNLRDAGTAIPTSSTTRCR